MKKEQKTVWTIGHSTRSLEEFVSLLHINKIKTLVDIRSLPGSRKFPQFNKEELLISMPENGIQYIHLLSLGGRRKVNPHSINTAWRHPAFRGYADYMQTEEFKQGIEELEKIGSRQQTAYMCSEAVWWSCHRSLVSDFLKLRGWIVLHIMSATKVVEHPYTQPARIIDGQLNYSDPG
jgi:uncharacterized protein (DUF488 family)